MAEGLGPIKSALFDNDGTITDIEPPIREVIQEARATMPAVRELHQGTFDELRNLTPLEAAVAFRGGPWVAAKLGVFSARRLQAKSGSIPAHTGADHMMRTVHDEIGLGTGVVSSGPRGHVERGLERNGLAGHVDIAVGWASLHNKARAIKKGMDRMATFSGEDPYPGVYIGDEVRDVQAASLVEGITPVYVTWGMGWHHGAERVADEFPEARIVESFDDLTNLLGGLASANTPD